MKLDRADRTLLFRTTAFALLASILFALVFASAHRVAHPASSRHAATWAAANAHAASQVRATEARSRFDDESAGDLESISRDSRDARDSRGSTDPFGHAAGDDCNAWNAALSPDLFASADQTFQNLGSFESVPVASRDAVFLAGRPVGLLLARAPPL